MNLLQRINAVQKAIKYVQKDKDVSTGGSSYMAVTHDQVTAMVRPHLVEHGIVIIPSLVDSVMNPPLVDKDMVAAKQRLYEATYDFAFCNVDDPTDVKVVRIQAHAMDNQDKAPGKALSYAKKYAILKVFEIETGENEESRVSDVSDLIAAISEAEDYEAALAAYNLAAQVCTSTRDKDSLATARAVMSKAKAKYAGEAK